MGAGQIRELTETRFVDTPAAPASAPAAAAAMPAAPEPAVPTPAEAEQSAPIPAEPVQAAPDPAAPAQTPDTPGSFDCEDIWNKVFEDGEEEKGSIYIIRNSAQLTTIEEKNFTVTVNNEFIGNLAEKNRNLLEHLVEKHTGKFRTMRIVLADSAREEKPAEEIAAAASDLLGIKVEVK